jgi:hypothetical protein
VFEKLKQLDFLLNPKELEDSKENDHFASAFNIGTSNNIKRQNSKMADLEMKALVGKNDEK